MNLIETLKENTIKAQNARLGILMIMPEKPEPLIMPDIDQAYPEKPQDDEQGTSD